MKAKKTILGVELLLLTLAIFLPPWIGLWDFPAFFLINFVCCLAIMQVFTVFYFYGKLKNIILIIVVFLKAAIFCISISLAILLRGELLFGYRVFHTPTESMLPTLMAGDFVFVNTHNQDYHKSDIVIFIRNDYKENIYFVKRIIYAFGDEFHGKVLDAQHVAVMGDNRNVSMDSRVFGAINKSDIAGRVVWIIGSGENQWRLDRFFSSDINLK